MSQQRILTAIDIGTDKCTTLIASHDPSKTGLKVLGVSAVPSRGMRRSQIVDLEQVLTTVTESLDAAERMAGQDVHTAYVSISGTHIQSLNSTGVVAVASPDQEINSEDVDRVIEAARAISLSSDREIIHVIPKDFKVDSQDGIKDPVGMTGVRLESEAHIITGMSTALKNIEKVIRDVGLQVDGFVFSGLAAAQVVLSETEKELGVAVVDIGAGSTSVCVYTDGTLAYSTALPIGARHITQDIALGCRVSLDVAEEIKLLLSKDVLNPLKPHPGESKQDFNKRRKQADQLDISKITRDPNSEPLSKSTVIEGVMLPRMKEIFALLSQQLDKHSLFPLIPAGIVLTGGGAQTAHIVEVAKMELNLSARIGMPRPVTGLLSDINNPSFATSIGLLEYGAANSTGKPAKEFSVGSLFKGMSGGSSAVKKISDFIKSLVP